MVESDIEDTRDLIRKKVNDIVDRLDSYSDEVVEHMTDINKLCNDADEDNWREIITDIQEKSISLHMITHKISTCHLVWLCWHLDSLSVMQKVRWTIGYMRNMIRLKLGLSVKPILIHD